MLIVLVVLACTVMLAARMFAGKGAAVVVTACCPEKMLPGRTVACTLTLINAASYPTGKLAVYHPSPAR